MGRSRQFVVVLVVNLVQVGGSTPAEAGPAMIITGWGDGSTDGFIGPFTAADRPLADWRTYMTLGSSRIHR
jgi:hypothetical protein